MDWYEYKIEEPIREIVRALRNEGVNTTCSCGHKMYVEGDYFDARELEMTISTIMVQMGLEFSLEMTRRMHNGVNDKIFFLQINPKITVSHSDHDNH